MGKVVSPKRIGEQWSDPAGLVLDAIGGRERKKVARYLSRAEGLIAGGYWTDPVTDNPAHRIPHSVITDGVWLWSSPWAYFVEKYGAALPVDFLEHIRALGYRPPRLSDERAQEIGIAEGVIPSAEVLAEAARIQAEYDAEMAPVLEAWRARQAEKESGKSD
jgi:hypothetical protein